MRELIGIIEVIKELQNFVISGKTRNPKYRAHSKEFFLDDTPQSKVYEDNESILKFSAMPKMSPHTNHIALPHHFFWSKVKAI